MSPFPQEGLGVLHCMNRLAPSLPKWRRCRWWTENPGFIASFVPWTAVRIVNPGIVAQQMEIAVIFGVSAALDRRIDIRKGMVQQTNGPSYSVTSLSEAPVVEALDCAKRAQSGWCG